MKNASSKIVLIAALTGFSCAAHAVDLYAGLGLGGGGIRITNPINGVTQDFGASASQFLMGVKLNENIAIEGEYVMMGQFQTGPRLDLSGAGVSAVAIMPFSDGKYSLFWKIGIMNMASKLTASPGFILTTSSTESKSGVSLGFGGQIAFTPNIALRVAINSYEYSYLSDTGRAMMVNAAGVFTF
jgi:opacity protein-like surface antigen